MYVAGLKSSQSLLFLVKIIQFLMFISKKLAKKEAILIEYFNVLSQLGLNRVVTMRTKFNFFKDLHAI